jgi:serine/threonine protein kinase
VLQVLQGKAQTAISLIDRVIGKEDADASMRSIVSKKGQGRRLKYAVWVKKSLNSVLVDLKEWSEVFDVSWYLIIRLSSKEIDQELDRVHAGEPEPLSTLKDLREAINHHIGTRESETGTVFLPMGFFDDENDEIKTGLLQSSAEIWRSRTEKTRYLVEQPSSTSTLSDICNLAKILQKVRSLEFGVLPCKGILKSPPGSRFVFSLPHSLTDPKNLRSLLLTSLPSSPLDNKFSIAKQLAKAVMFVHSAGFVHKNIRPETIFVLRDEETELRLAFLTGFERFRLAEGKTQHQGDDLWETNLYRHPTRQGVQPEEDYTIQHDIYSLGVCLLEVGLGSSLVLWKTGEVTPVPNPEILDIEKAPPKDRRKRAFDVKRMLVRIAREQLASKMGRKYADITAVCLTCLDKNDNGFGDEEEFLDENGIHVGVRFIEKLSTDPTHILLILTIVDIDGTPRAQNLNYVRSLGVLCRERELRRMFLRSLVINRSLLLLVFVNRLLEMARHLQRTYPKFLK